MDNATHVSFNADDRSYFAILKREIHDIAAGAGFAKTRMAEIDIIVAEITSNLNKHARGGEILVRVINDGRNTGIEIIAIDSGPGIADIKGMMTDGVSTKKTLGQGLGAIKRLSDFFEIYSQAGWGTIVLVRVYTARYEAPVNKRTEARYILVAKPGEKVAGDGLCCFSTNEYFKVLAADGLGHGPEAHKAANMAIENFKTCPYDQPVDIIKYLHPNLKKSRGVVGTVAIYNYKTRLWQVAGVGNILTRVVSNNLLLKSCMSYNGIIGMAMPNTMTSTEFIMISGQYLVFTSDGIKTKWDFSKYNSIFKYDLTIFAAAVYKDQARRNDDMSVLVVSNKPV